ncbi:MAG: oxidoreductase, partial [Halobacteriaceae archaeon]
TSFNRRMQLELEDLDDSDAYERVYEFYDDYEAVSGVLSSSPDDVADVILQAGTCANPRARYTVGPLAKLGLVGSRLPEEWRHRVYRLASKFYG